MATPDCRDRTERQRSVCRSFTADLALTGRKITAMEAKEMGLVTRVFDSKKELDAGVAKIAKGINIC